MLQNDAAMTGRRVGWFEHLAHHVRVLIDDRGKGDGVDHALHVPFLGVMQGETQAGQRLAAAGGHGQREEPFRVCRTIEAMLGDVGAQAIDGLALFKPRQVRFKASGQGAPFFVAAVHPVARHSGLFEIRRVDPVRVDQATEQEARQQANLLLSDHLLPGSRIGLENFGECKLHAREQLWRLQQSAGVGDDFWIGGGKRFVKKSSVAPLRHAFAKRVLAIRRNAIDQTGMVRSDAQRKHLANQTTQTALLRQLIPDQLCSGRRVVDSTFETRGVDIVFVFILIEQANRRFQVALKGLAVFAEVVQQADQFALRAKADLGRVRGRHRANIP